MNNFLILNNYIMYKWFLSKKQFCMILFYLGCLTTYAQSFILSPGYLPLYKQYCKGTCIQFTDSSFYIPSQKPQPWADTVIKRMWYFTGTSTKQIPYNFLGVGNPFNQPLFPFASDTFIYTTKQNPPLLCYDSVGSFNIGMCCQFANGWCHNTKILLGVIEIIDAPKVIEQGTQHINLNFGDEYTLTACAKDSKYNWEPTNELGGCNTCDNYITKPFSNTTYTCNITNINGCKKKCIYDIELKDPLETLYVPNSFTPNNDNLNDTFFPVIPYYKNATMQLFNRWGVLIYTTNDIKNGWDGTFKNLKLPNDVYTYKIDVEFLDRTTKTKTGNVTLIR